MRGFLTRYGSLAVFSARFIAGLRFLAGPLAGAIGMRLRPFMIGNVLGAVVFVPVAVGAGYAVGVGLGAQVERVRRVLGEVEHLLLIGAVVVIGVLLSLRVLRVLSAGLRDLT